MKIKKIDRVIALPIFSAILIGLSRWNLDFDSFIFVSFVPLFYFFEYTTNKNKPYLPRLFYTGKQYFGYGFLFSTVLICLFLYWINLVTIIGFLGLILLFGLIFGFIFWYVSKIYHYIPKFAPIWFSITWIFFEYLTNFSEFHFPWFAIGYGLKNKLYLLQVLELGGLPLLSFCILGINYLLYLAFQSIVFSTTAKNMIKGLKFLAIVIILLLFWGGTGFWRMQQINKNTEEKTFKIALIQGNIPQDLKWEEEMEEETFLIYERLAKEVVKNENPNLILYPEAALPSWLYIWPSEYYQLMSLVVDLNTPIFTGFPHYIDELKYEGQDEPRLYYNAANLFTPDIVKHEKYYKNILVPFGERTPFLSLFPLLWKLQMGQANFESGNSSVLYKIEDYTFTPLICFEIAFPLFIKKTVQNINPDYLVNITNDAWFYRSIGTHQHAMMAVFRTIETRKQVFRVANTGYSFYTMPSGEMKAMTNLFERCYLVAYLNTYHSKTPYIQYGYLLHLFLITLFILQLAYIIINSLKKRQVCNKKNS